MEKIVAHKNVQTGLITSSARRCGSPLLLCLLDPLRDLLCGHLSRRIVAELFDQARHRRKDAGLLLVIHQPFDELRVNGLPLRRSRKDHPGSLHALDEQREFISLHK